MILYLGAVQKKIGMKKEWVEPQVLVSDVEGGTVLSIDGESIGYAS
jgi:hypothetical protein